MIWLGWSHEYICVVEKFYKIFRKASKVWKYNKYKKCFWRKSFGENYEWAWISAKRTVNQSQKMVSHFFSDFQAIRRNSMENNGEGQGLCYILGETSAKRVTEEPINQQGFWPRFGVSLAACPPKSQLLTIFLLFHYISRDLAWVQFINFFIWRRENSLGRKKAWFMSKVENQ